MCFSMKQKMWKYLWIFCTGNDEKLQETDHIVIANNHEPIVDYKIFAVVQEQMKQRSKSNYRGVKKFDNVDGFVTDKKNKVLMLGFADCTPLLFYDPTKKVIANTHSGWKGTLQTIGLRTVEKMQKEYDCKPEDIICCIGPHIRKCHFEVDKNVRDLFYNKFKDLKGIEEIIGHNEENNKYYIDTARINKQTLLNAGLKEENIIDSNICTVCHSDICHSFRAEKELSGRAVTMIELV